MNSIAKAAIAVLLVAGGVAAWAEVTFTDEGTAVAIPPATGSKHVKSVESRRVENDRGAQRRRGPYLDPLLVEGSTEGFLPRIGPDGRKPATVYAAAVPNVNGRIIGVVVTGFGLRDAVLRQALKALKTPVSLGFSPYGDKLDKATRAARERGHETFLVLPTGGNRHEETDSGPAALVTGLAAAETTRRLHWSMARFGGYVGIFSPSSTKPLNVAGELVQRGLLHLSPDSRFVRSGGKLLRIPRSGLTPENLAKALTRARKTAEKAKTILVLPALPAAIDGLAKWIGVSAAAATPVHAAPASAIMVQP